MAENRRYLLNAHLDIQQIISEAQHRWLRPAEICEILQNHKNFRITPEPPSRPPNGSLFLFDRKVLRYFRKDGHNWRKKKDGKTVKEAHERLKSGSIDVLHCYYAHGEDNENFQRRSYWMLEEELAHIVLVHYREVKGNKTNYNRIRDPNGIPAGQKNVELSNSEVDGSAASRFQSYDYQRASPVTDTTSLVSTQASEHEDAESAYRHQASPGFQSIYDLQSPAMQKIDAGPNPYHHVPLSNNYQGQSLAIPGMSFGSITQGKENKNSLDNGMGNEFQQDLEFSSWNNIVESSTSGYQSSYELALPSNHSNQMSMIPGEEHDLLDQVFSGAFRKEEFESRSDVFEDLQASNRDSLNTSKWPIDQRSDGNMNLRPYYPSYDLITKLDDVNQVGQSDSMGLHIAHITDKIRQSSQNDVNALNAHHKSEHHGSLNVEEKVNHPALRKPILGGVMRENLKKLDSFDRWMSKELGDVTELTLQPSSESYWETVGSEGGDKSVISAQLPLDNYILGPSLSQDQLFSIIDFSPNWAYSGIEIKVLIMGKFLRSREEVENHNWACMFGELEVPAEIVGDGVLRCLTPPHAAGRVSFYVTQSNRLACSEVREFEFRASPVEEVDSEETRLRMRFVKLLSLGSGISQASFLNVEAETSQLCSKISALMRDDTEWEQMLSFSKHDLFSADEVKDQLLEKLLKEKLHNWLLQKIVEGGKGPNVLDEDGQGVLHFAAALGYDWAIPPTIASGVSVNFRDANGWTALHWAAYYGRERTVVFLVTLGAAPGAMTDPTSVHPAGTPPADLASSNGHKGIAGYLAESALSSHLEQVDIKDSKDREKAVETSSERFPTPGGAGDLANGLSMKDSLAALRNATQAAARIHQVFRVQSFQRKQLNEYNDDEFGTLDERTLSLLSSKTKKSGQRDEPVQAAAIRIQNKFRSWKGRKDFLLIRQRIIKIQAHVRGHQVRKNYKKIIWSVGILDKIILRWRRKGRGLTRFRPEVAAGTSMVDAETKEDDYDFLKEGRKQTEKNLQKALARVKSMVQYPEARDQYRRLLNVVSEMEEKKAAQERMLNSSDIEFDDDLIDFESLFEDDAFMPMTS